MKFEITHLDTDILVAAYSVTKFRPGYQFNPVRTFMVLSKSIAALLRKGETQLATDLINTRKHLVEQAFNACETAMKLKKETRTGMRIIIKTLDSGAQPLGMDVWEVSDDFDMEALRKSAKQMLNITLSYRVIATPNTIGDVVKLELAEQEAPEAVKPLTVDEMDKSAPAFVPAPPANVSEICKKAADILCTQDITVREHVTVVGEIMHKIAEEPGFHNQYLWETACSDIARTIENNRVAKGGEGNNFYVIKAAILGADNKQLLKLVPPTPTPTPTPTPPDSYETTLAEAVGIICNPKSTDINHVTAVFSVISETMTQEGSELYKSEIWNVACACIARQIVNTKKLVDNSLFFKIKDAIVKVQRTLLLSYIDDTVVPETPTVLSFNAVVKASTKTITNRETKYEEHLLAVAKVATELDGEDVSDNDENTDNWGRAAFYIANEIANHRPPLSNDEFNKLKNAIASANRLETLQILN